MSGEGETQRSTLLARANERVLDEPYGVDVLAPAFEPRSDFAQPYAVSREEMFKGLANRFVHSTTYLYLYGSMAGLSLVTVVLSLQRACPGPFFYLLELLINVALVAEVGVRLVAFGKHFWKSTFNIVDLCLVAVCLLTLLTLLFGHGCSPMSRSRSGRSEELLDSALLIVRNVVQCLRLVSVVRRSGYNVASRVSAIDLSEAHGYNLDMDLEEESSLAQQRMREGGDLRAYGRGWTPQTSAFSAPRGEESVIAMDDAEL